MDPRRLLVFREVARAGSLTAAARALGWTQPAVSQHLAALERSVGLPLVLRGPTGTSLTEAGEVLLRRADAVAAELHAAEEELASLAQLRAGRVRLHCFPSAAATLVPEAVRALATSHPGISVGLVEAEPPEALAAVGAGDADPDEILAGTRHGVYVAQLGGGQVNTATGDFVFGMTEAYLIEDGELTYPIRDGIPIMLPDEARKLEADTGSDKA